MIDSLRQNVDGMRCDVAKILRKNKYVAREAAIELWRQGVSGLDIALASSLSDPQRLDLIDAVDELVKRRNLSNRKEKIMSPNNDRQEFGTPFNPVSTVIEQDGENDRQGEVGEDSKAEADSNLGVDTVDDNLGADMPSEEDTARLHVALKDPHISQDGYVSEPAVDEGDTLYMAPEKTELTSLEDPDRGRPSGILVDRDAGAADPDRERLTDVDHVLNEKEKKEDPAGGTMEIIPTYRELEKNRDHWAAEYCGLKKDYDRLVLAVKTVELDPCAHPPTVRDDVYKLIDGERDYQNQRLFSHNDKDWVPNDWLTFIEDYTFRAREATNDGHDAQMIEIRKIAALAVAAMEHILTPARM